MKAITIWQPWATALALGIKHNETRSWETNYRGPIAIHAAKKKPDFHRAARDNMFTKDIYLGRDYISGEIALITDNFNYNKLPLGAIVATANLVECMPITPEYVVTLSPQELALGDYTIGRFAWVLEDVVMLEEAIPCRGQQRLWECMIDLHQ